MAATLLRDWTILPQMCAFGLSSTWSHPVFWHFRSSRLGGGCIWSHAVRILFCCWKVIWCKWVVDYALILKDNFLVDSVLGRIRWTHQRWLRKWQEERRGRNACRCKCRSRRSQNGKAGWSIEDALGPSQTWRIKMNGKDGHVRVCGKSDGFWTVIVVNLGCFSFSSLRTCSCQEYP